MDRRSELKADLCFEIEGLRDRFGEFEDELPFDPECEYEFNRLWRAVNRLRSQADVVLCALEDLRKDIQENGVDEDGD